MRPTDSAARLDPVTLEIAWGRLQSVTDEAEITLIRTAFSTIIREANDFGVVIMDASAGSVAQSQRSMPSFVGTLPRTLAAAFEKFPEDSLVPGDVLATNDPWLGTGHLPDMTVMRPIYRNGRIIAYSGCIAHWADIGGALWAGDTREVFEEGLLIPPCKLVQAGEIDDTILSIVLGNVRLPRQVLGDIHAQLATIEVADVRLNRLLDDMGIDDPEPLFTEIQQRSETAMRAAIEELPDGTYVHEMEIDGIEEPLTLRAAVTVAGSEIEVDWTGSSPQVTVGSINETYNHAYSMTVYPIKCALSPDVPNNAGSHKPITMIAPEGTIINAKRPGAVSSRQVMGHCVSAAVFGALAQIVPDRVIADSGSPCPRILFSGRDADGEKYGAHLFLSGGMGAQQHRDGLSAAPFPSNAGATSVEVIESATPLVFRERSLVPDSGGPGQFRGGLGVATAVELGSGPPCTVSIMTDRIEHPPLGRFGGEPGAPNVLGRSSGEPVPATAKMELATGDLLHFASAGGGGFGPVGARDRKLIDADLVAGLVTVGATEAVYGKAPA